eukprot:scaffold52332_cov33-Phaeocystis_antarctica.AAC.1
MRRRRRERRRERRRSGRRWIRRTLTMRGSRRGTSGWGGSLDAYGYSLDAHGCRWRVASAGVLSPSAPSLGGCRPTTRAVR